LNILVLYVHKSNPVTLNAPQQVDAIFSSTLTCGYKQYLTRWEETWVGHLSQVKRWSTLGYFGKKFSGNIEVYREENEESLDSLLFRETALCGGKFKSVSVKTTTIQGAIGRVAYNPKAITFGRITDRTNEVSVVPVVTVPLPVGYEGSGYLTDFVEPSVENVKNGRYPLARFIWIYVNKSPEKVLSYLETAFIQLTLSKTGQNFFKEKGLLSPLSLIN
jgi:phosphate transport system substrate-binding protein